MPGAVEEPCLAIDVDSGLVTKCNEPAATLLGGDLTGLAWSRVVTGDRVPDGLLAYLASSSRHLLLPPFLLERQDSTEIILGGLLFPPVESRVVRLLLWPHLEDKHLAVGGQLGSADTLAVLGFEGMHCDGQWRAADTKELMDDIRHSLLEIVRRSDTVGAVSAASLFIVIRDLEVEGARDICLALLSHMHRDTRLRLSERDLRIGIGVARRASNASALSTLWAANNALLVARGLARKESIRTADEQDYSLLVGRALGGDGVFGGPPGDDSPATVTPQTGANVPPSSHKTPPPVAPIERDIEGYVVDNMEGAVDQAIFLARLDTPIAVLGPAGTGKMYIARIIHEESGGAPDMLVSIDCRDFRSRNAAHARIAQELGSGEGKTLVFKSPHLLHAEVQQKLARQISSRRLADASPARALPRMNLIALFPEPLEVLMRRQELVEQLASAFAGYPIRVPPIRDRKQAVLRWAHKILGQEGELRDRDMKGFTPDAEQAMLQYDWPGNISEMRQCIHDALEKTDKNWLTPVDLGLFKGISAEGTPEAPATSPFLAAPQQEEEAQETYAPSTLEAVHVALGEAVHNLLSLGLVRPLGLWLEDELVLAALDRYRGDARRAAEFLHTRPRNISRWLPKIESREDERGESSLWQESRRLLREWVRESPQPEESPLSLMADGLLAHLTEQGGELSTAKQARIVGVSTPTYLKRLREQEDRKPGD